MSSPNAKPSKERHPLRTVVQWSIVALIFYFIGRRLAQDWEQLAESNLAFAPVGFSVSVVLLGLYMLMRALIWHHLTRLLNTSIPVGQALRAWFSSQLGKYVPGKVFLYIGRLHYYTREGRDAGKVSLAFGLELVATFSASILTVLVSALTVTNARIEAYKPFFIVGLVLMLIALHPRILSAVTGIAYRLFKQEPFRITVSYPALLRFIALYVLNWILFGLSLYAFINSFYSIPADSIVYLAGAFSFSSLMGMVAVFVPSGLGVREGLLGIFLLPLMPEAIGLLAALAARVWFTAVELSGVGVVALVSRFGPADQGSRFSSAIRRE